MKNTSQLSIKQSQNLAMTQSLQQAIRILQLNQQELQQEINELLDSNIMLEIDSDINEPAIDEMFPNNATTDVMDSYEEGNSSEQSLDFDSENFSEAEVELDWDSLDEVNASGVHTSNDDEALDPFNRLSEVHSKSLHEELMWQLDMSVFSDEDRDIATLIIDSINNDGYLTVPLSELLQSMLSKYEGLTEADIEVVLKRIQRFEPAGVAARTLEECLINQIKDLSPEPLWANKAIYLLTYYADALAKLDLTLLKRRLNVDEAGLREILQALKHLEPKPGRQLSRTSVEAIVPEILVNVENNTINVALNSDVMPKLRINSEYARMAQLAKQNNGMLRQHLNDARFFIKNVHSRFDTLLRVASEIVTFQKEFFLKGESAMRPMQLHMIAEVLALHESTVSRAVAGKYLMCPSGIYELKFFFSSQISHANGNQMVAGIKIDSGEEDVSAVAVRAALKELIARENPEKPLSDAKLVELLNQQGFKIARRTIAKYRELLGILGSSERKRLA